MTPTSPVGLEVLIALPTPSVGQTLVDARKMESKTLVHLPVDCVRTLRPLIPVQQVHLLSCRPKAPSKSMGTATINSVCGKITYKLFVVGELRYFCRLHADTCSVLCVHRAQDA